MPSARAPRAAGAPLDARELHGLVVDRLAPAGFAAPEREASALLAAVLDRSPGDLELDRLLGRRIPGPEVERVLAAAARRARREPLQHLVGTAPFFGLDLAVGPGVFVPRPETELLVEAALERLAPPRAGARPRIADLGSGSGAIVIALAEQRPDARLLALEASPRAWPWLRRNLRALAPAVEPRFGDWRRQLERERGGEPFALLVSNPPYVPSRDIPADPEVRRHDPTQALYSGADGLDEIRRIAAAAAELLERGGHVLVEHTERQGEEVRRVFAEAGLGEARTLADLTGRDRITLASAV